MSLMILYYFIMCGVLLHIHDSQTQENSISCVYRERFIILGIVFVAQSAVDLKYIYFKLDDYFYKKVEENWEIIMNDYDWFSCDKKIKRGKQLDTNWFKAQSIEHKKTCTVG